MVKCNYYRNSFCFVCSNFTPIGNRIKIEETIKKAYKYCFDVDLIENKFSPNTVCNECKDEMFQSIAKKSSFNKFQIPAIWSEPNQNHDNCFLCKFKNNELNSPIELSVKKPVKYNEVNNKRKLNDSLKCKRLEKKSIDKLDLKLNSKTYTKSNTNLDLKSISKLDKKLNTELDLNSDRKINIENIDYLNLVNNLTINENSINDNSLITINDLTFASDATNDNNSTATNISTITNNSTIINSTLPNNLTMDDNNNNSTILNLRNESINQSNEKYNTRSNNKSNDNTSNNNKFNDNKSNDKSDNNKLNDKSNDNKTDESIGKEDLIIYNQRTLDEFANNLKETSSFNDIKKNRLKFNSNIPIQDYRFKISLNRIDLERTAKKLDLKINL